MFILCQPGSKGRWIEPQRCAASLTELDIGQAILTHQVMQSGAADFEQLHHLLVSQEWCGLHCSVSGRSVLHAFSSCSHSEDLLPQHASCAEYAQRQFNACQQDKRLVAGDRAKGHGLRADHKHLCPARQQQPTMIGIGSASIDAPVYTVGMPSYLTDPACEGAMEGHAWPAHNGVFSFAQPL